VDHQGNTVDHRWAVASCGWAIGTDPVRLEACNPPADTIEAAHTAFQLAGIRGIQEAPATGVERAPTEKDIDAETLPVEEMDIAAETALALASVAAETALAVASAGQAQWARHAVCHSGGKRQLLEHRWHRKSTPREPWRE